MATPPPEQSILDDKPQLPSVEANISSILDAKTVTVKQPDTVMGSQVNQDAVDANQAISPVVNGSNGVDQPPAPNGVKESSGEESVAPKTPTTPAESLPVPAPPPVTEVSPSVDPVAEPAPTPVVEEPQPVQLSQPAEPEPEPTVPVVEETPKPDGTETPSVAPETQDVNTSPSGLETQPEPSSIPPSAPMSEPPQSSAPSEQAKPQVSRPLSEEPSVRKEPATQDIPSEPAPVTFEPAQESPAVPETGVTAQTTEQTVPVIPPVETQPQGDQVMTDAPPASPTKVAREREEDVGEEPAAKRAKTEDVTQEAEFKVPELPASASALSEETKQQPEGGMTKLQSKFLIRTMQTLKRTHDARFFREPVDPVKLNIPSYPNIIKTPMDLGTIDERLKNGHYTTVDGFIADFDLMIKNSETFNGPEHVVTLEGKKLRQSLSRHLEKLPKPDEVEPTAAEKKAKKSSTAPTKSQPARRESRAPAPTARAGNASSPTTTFALNPEGLPVIRRDSTTVDGRPKRSIHPPKNRDLPYSAKPKKKKYQLELKFCQEVLDELHKPRHYTIAAPFYLPVDPVALNIPNYHSIIKKPMDLQTIQTKLRTGQYENAKEMEADVRLMFKNCYKFNVPNDPTWTAGKALEDLFDSKWAQKSRWIEAREPSSGHQSSSSDESESEESEDEGDEKLSLLQKQIAEMSKQVEAITKKKKKTPPGDSKKSKSKSGKKDSKKGGASGGSSGKKDSKKGAKAGKSGRARFVTYHEKQMISTGISNLNEKRMGEALNIIKTHVPSLGDGEDGEIELDIDQIPNDVLLILLNFVKKHSTVPLEDEPEPEPVRRTTAPPKPKKNKPMSKYEQEEQINRLSGNLERFRGGAGAHSPDPLPSVEIPPVESSDDDEDSEESEEE